MGKRKETVVGACISITPRGQCCRESDRVRRKGVDRVRSLTHTATHTHTHTLKTARPVSDVERNKWAVPVTASLFTRESEGVGTNYLQRHQFVEI